MRKPLLTALMRQTVKVHGNSQTNRRDISLPYAADVGAGAQYERLDFIVGEKIINDFLDIRYLLTGRFEEIIQG